MINELSAHAESAKFSRNVDQIISILFCTFFGLYVLFVTFILFFSRVGIFDQPLAINIDPFSSIIVDITQLATPLWRIALNHLLINLFLFTPMGWYLPILTPGRSKVQYLAAIILMGLLAEVVQAVFRLGVADIDDLILYLLGGLLGLMIHSALLVWLKEPQRVKLFTAIFSSVIGLTVIGVVVYQIIDHIIWMNSL